jgi:hypothetical protein
VLCFKALVEKQVEIKRNDEDEIILNPNLPLGNLGIFFDVNENRRIRVVFPKLTSEGDVQYICS